MSRQSGWTIKRFVVALLALVLIACLLVIVWWIAAAPSYASLERLLVETSGFDPLRDVEPRVANEAAVAIEEQAAELGLLIAPADREDRPRPTPEQAALFEEIGPSLQELTDALMSGQAESLEPAADLESFLDRHRDALERIAAVLHSSSPMWDLDLRQGGSFELPRLLGHLNTHHLLLLLGLRGDSGEAASWIDAALRLRRSLEGEPPIIYVLIYLSELRHELAVLRRLETWPVGAREELERLLAERTIERDTLRSFRVEPWIILQMLRNGEFDDPEWPRYLRGAVDRLGRHGVRHQHRAMEKMIELTRAKSLKDYDQQAVFDGGMVRIPKWSLVARIVIPDLSDVFIKAARAELDIELTLRVISAKEALAEQDCRSLESRQPSVIEGIDWLYTCTADGALRLEPSHLLGQVVGHALAPGITLAEPSSPTRPAPAS